MEEAVIPLANIEYSYGFGVYENLKVRNGIIYFLKEHLLRLQESCRVIGLEHPFSEDTIVTAVQAVVRANKIENANLKILLIGGKTKEAAELFILPLNPLYPEDKWYKEGVVVITYPYEREYSKAKTLNMLSSYLAYKKAREAGCYDALLVDREGFIREGTRTNFFTIRGKTIFSPPEEKMLDGVTRKTVLQVARENGYEVVLRDIVPNDLGSFDGAFLTSTSSKILPVRKIDAFEYSVIPDALRQLMKLYDTFLDASGGVLK